MEIFKTIWTALTTENELLSMLLLIPDTFIEILVNMLLFTTLLNIHAEKKVKIKYVLTYSHS